MSHSTPEETVAHSPDRPARTTYDPPKEGTNQSDPDNGTPLPQTIGTYEILELLGHGGMGVVYKARQPELNRLVALKMIRPAVADDDETVARFRVEAEVVARLHHAAIVQIHEIGSHAGRPFLSLEFVPGGSLATRLQSGPLTPLAAAELVEELAGAVAHAHRAHVVHRDLKPANVLLDLDGKPKVADFGLARLLDGDAGLSRTGTVVGTPSYMAPEQADGRGRPIGPPADVYALGAILYECLTGRPPFRAAGILETLQQVVDQEPVSPCRLNPQVDRDLDTICLKCLQKTPAQRYQSAQDLAEDLRRYRLQEPIQARRIGRIERVFKWTRRRPAAAAACVLLILTAVLGLGGGTAAWLWLKAEAQRRHVASALNVAQQARVQAEASARGEAQAVQELAVVNYYHRVYLAHQAWWDGAVGRTLQLLQECPDPLRGWEWHYVRRLCHTEIATLPGSFGLSDRGVAFSPDGRYLALANGKHHAVLVQDLVASQPKFVLSGHTGRVLGVAFSPDGTRLASSAADKTIRIWETHEGKLLQTLTGHTAEVNSIAFSQDGTQLASASQDKTLRLWDVAAGKIVHLFSGHKAPVRSVAFGPDGAHLVSGSQDRTVRLWDTKTGKETRILGELLFHADSVAFSPDGTLVAGGSRGADGMVKLWSIPAGRQLFSEALHGNGVLCVAFSPDGRTLASGGADTVVRILDVATNKERLTWRGHTSVVQALAFSPDGTRVASSGHEGVTRVWDTAVRQDATVLATPPPAQAVSVHPDGSWFAVAIPGGIRLFSLGSGTQIKDLTDHGAEMIAVACSPDGQRLASAGQQESIEVWDTNSGKVLLTLPGHGPVVRALVFSPDSSLLASAGVDQTIRLHDARTGQPGPVLRGHQGTIQGLAWSPDGKLLASCGQDRRLCVWELATEQKKWTWLARSNLNCVAFSPDGTRLAVGGAEVEGITIFDATTGQNALKLTGHTGATSSLAFSPDGSRLATGSHDKTIKLWDARRGMEILTLRGHNGHVAGLKFSPDGRRLLSSGSWDGTVRIWDSGQDAR